jgi:hypothetical protein
MDPNYMRFDPLDPKNAARRAVLLAVLPVGAPAKQARIVQAQHGGLQLHRTYTVGKDVSLDEIRVLLKVDDLLHGSRFELFDEMITTERLLVGILTTDVNAIARAAADFGVSETDILAQLKSAGLDLEQRTLAGHPWTQLDHAMKHSWNELQIVEHVRSEYGEISLAHAKLINESFEIGHQFKLPVGIDRQTCPGLLALFAADDADTVRYVETRSAATFESLRVTVAVQTTPPALRGFELGPLRFLYREGHGVLYADVAGNAARTLWHRLDVEAASTGFRPVILGGDASDLRDGMTAWAASGAYDGLQAGAHPNHAPLAVLEAVDGVDLAALLAPGGNPSYPNLLPEEGDWPAEPSSNRLGALHRLGGEIYSKVRIALVPVDQAWKTIAYLPMLLQAGEATPSLAQACAVSREWEHTFGAKVISVRPAMVEWWLERPPSRETALKLAPAHFTFTPEGGSNVLQERANELVSEIWSSWWD